MAWLWLLLLRHSAKSSHAQEERLTTLTELVIRLHLPHAIVVRLYRCKKQRCYSNTVNDGHSWLW